MPLYKASFLSPEDEYRDMSVLQNFTCQVNARGSQVTTYNVIIYNNDTGLQLYTTGDVVLGTALSDGEILTMPITGGSVANNLNLKWTVTCKNATESVLSFESFFISANQATISVTIPATVTSQRFNFVGAYTQADGIAYDFWYYEFYDSNNNLLLRTDKSSSFVIEYEFSGFLNGSTYSMKAFADMPDGSTIESLLYQFNVSYSVPEIVTKPTATQNCELNAVDIGWGGIVQNAGSISGGSFSYISNFMTVGNKGLSLGAGAILEYLVDIPEDFTAHHVWQPVDALFDGDIFELYNSVTTENLKVGYDNTLDVFVKTLNGNPISGINFPISASNFYLFFLQTNTVYIYEFNSSFVLLNSQTI